jgi:hypothetical protein
MPSLFSSPQSLLNYLRLFNTRPVVLFIHTADPVLKLSMARASQNFAEYQDSAPEPIAQSQATGSGNPEGGRGSQPGHVVLSVGEMHKKKVLGLAPRTAFALIFIASIVIVGIVIGAVLGTNRKNHTDKLPTLYYQALSGSGLTVLYFSNSDWNAFSNPIFYWIWNSYCYTNGSYHHSNYIWRSRCYHQC